MDLKKILIRILILWIILNTIRGALASEGIQLFDNDNPIMIYEIVQEENGSLCTGATVNLTLYYENGTYNQSHLMQELSTGLYNQTLGILPIGFYPMKIVANKSTYYGVSDKEGIKVVDELPSDFKDQLDEINSSLHYFNDSLFQNWNNMFYHWNGTVFVRMENNMTKISDNFDLVFNNLSLVLDYFNCSDENISICSRLIDLNSTLTNTNLSLQTKIDNLNCLTSSEYEPFIGSSGTTIIQESTQSNKILKIMLIFIMCVIILLLLIIYIQINKKNINK